MTSRRSIGQRAVYATAGGALRLRSGSPARGARCELGDGRDWDWQPSGERERERRVRRIAEVVEPKLASELVVRILSRRGSGLCSMFYFILFFICFALFINLFIFAKFQRPTWLATKINAKKWNFLFWLNNKIFFFKLIYNIIDVYLLLIISSLVGAIVVVLCNRITLVLSSFWFLKHVG